MSLRRETKQIELTKVKREITRHGIKFSVYREIKDSYNEGTGKFNFVIESIGLYHIQKGYVTRKISDGGEVTQKGSPKLMLIFDDCVSINNDDIIVINETAFAVRDKNNIEELNIICDLSLEVLQYEDKIRFNESANKFE